MLLIIALPVLILGWFFYQLGRKKRWEEEQKQLTQERPSMEIFDAPKDRKKQRKDR